MLRSFVRTNLPLAYEKIDFAIMFVLELCCRHYDKGPHHNLDSIETVFLYILVDRVCPSNKIVHMSIRSIMFSVFCIYIVICDALILIVQKIFVLIMHGRSIYE